MLNQFFDKYIFTNTLKYAHNNFYLVNLPFVIAPTDLLLTLCSVPDQKFQRKIYSSVKEDAKKTFLPRFSELGIEKEKELSFLKILFTASGWGKIEVIDKNDETKRAIVVIDNSPFAQALRGKVQFPVDTILRGLFAGVFSALFNVDVDCVESECVALNHQNCKLIIKPKIEFDLTSKIVQEQIPFEDERTD